MWCKMIFSQSFPFIVSHENVPKRSRLPLRIIAQINNVQLEVENVENVTNVVGHVVVHCS